MADEQQHDPEMISALGPPTILVNRFYTFFSPRGVRIAFGERSLDGVTRHSVAVQTDISTAEELARNLLNIIDQLRAKNAQPPAPRAGGAVH